MGDRCERRALVRGKLATRALLEQIQKSAGARQKLALPCQRVANDGLQVIEMRLPFEQRAGPVGSRHDLCGVAGPPARECDLKVDAGDPLYRLDDFEHGKTTAVTAIERD